MAHYISFYRFKIQFGDRTLSPVLRCETIDRQFVSDDNGNIIMHTPSKNSSEIICGVSYLIIKMCSSNDKLFLLSKNNILFVYKHKNTTNSFPRAIINEMIILCVNVNNFNVCGNSISILFRDGTNKMFWNGSSKEIVMNINFCKPREIYYGIYKVVLSYYNNLYYDDLLILKNISLLKYDVDFIICCNYDNEIFFGFNFVEYPINKIIWNEKITSLFVVQVSNVKLCYFTTKDGTYYFEYVGGTTATNSIFSPKIIVHSSIVKKIDTGDYLFS